MSELAAGLAAYPQRLKNTSATADYSTSRLNPDKLLWPGVVNGDGRSRTF
jgi:hypothetical protein